MGGLGTEPETLNVVKISRELTKVSAQIEKLNTAIARLQTEIGASKKQAPKKSR